MGVRARTAADVANMVLLKQMEAHAETCKSAI